MRRCGCEKSMLADIAAIESVLNVIADVFSEGEVFHIIEMPMETKESSMPVSIVALTSLAERVRSELADELACVPL